jgi:hypothetical protein
MKVANLFLLLVAMLFSSGVTLAQGGDGVIRVLPSGETFSVSSDGKVSFHSQAAGLPEGQVEGMRPADDSDPEMQALWNKIIHTGSCNTAIVLCEPRLGEVKKEGARMASYLISQYELSEARSKGTGDSYLRFLGATGERGINYLLEKTYKRETMQIGLEGLLFASDVRAIDAAGWILSLNDRSLGKVNAAAVTVIRVNMISSGTIREGDVALLRRLEDSGALRPLATMALKDLEARGLIAAYPHPEDLKMWVPEAIQYEIKR